MTLIVDSGSTKTTWRVGIDGANAFIIVTLGINPVRDSADTIREVVKSAVSQINDELINGRASSLVSSIRMDNIYFYGAGCTPTYSPIVADVLREAFAGAEVQVESDMLGAARALCQHEAGIACILGTGANSCLYDGERITRQVSPLGWILGDEGSGAVLGRTLLTDALKHQLPEELCSAFLTQYELDAAAAIEHVYRQPMPNRWLASLVPFIVEHRQHPDIQNLLSRQFRSFFRRNIVPYNCSELPIHFIGGIAGQFESELRLAAEAEGFKVGEIVRDPIERLAAYHSKTAR